MARARQARKDVLRLAQSGLDSITLAAKAERILRAVIPFDRACWHNVDPATRMLTSVMGDSAPTSPLLPMLEYGALDINRYADVALGPVTAAGLVAATHGDPRRSRRYREVLEPMHIEDELTVAFVVDATLWGCARFYRGSRWPAFDPVEIAFLGSLSAVLAQGFRTALVNTARCARTTTDGPGLVVLNRDDTVASVSPSAQRWLHELIDDVPAQGALLPRPLMAVAGQARAIAAGDAAATMARCRVPTRSGRWLILHGEQLEVGGDACVSIIVEPAPAVAIAPLIVSAYGLTPREREVTRCLLHGMPNKAIAKALDLSVYTVADHIRLVFEKIGVNSRTELSARLFFEHCVPGISTGRALNADGWFVETTDDDTEGDAGPKGT